MWPTLRCCLQRGPLALMQLLLDHGADVHLANAEGWQPLQLAAR
jgi:ankyrin repeat protein